MFIAYFDESGDDGYPKMSSELFVLTSLYLHHSTWKKTFGQIYAFRRQLKDKMGLLVKEEFHTREFITDKDPYHGRFSATVRRETVFDFFKLLPTLDIKFVNVVIDKRNIRRPDYPVLQNALTYNTQRIENDLEFFGDAGCFMIITDEGRLAPMRETLRRIQRVNFIPSKVTEGYYRKEIKRLIEDPLPKSSDQSYFIQLADMMAFIVNLHTKRVLCKPEITWGKRIQQVIQPGDDEELLRIAQPVLNLKASGKNAHGIVYYPKI